jgi:hypothetical protein
MGVERFFFFISKLPGLYFVQGAAARSMIKKIFFFLKKKVIPQCWLKYLSLERTTAPISFKKSNGPGAVEI